MSSPYKQCPSCDGYGEVMTRGKMILDSDGSEDIGGTPYPTACLRCDGEGEILKTEVRIELLEANKQTIQMLEKEMEERI